MQMTNKLVDKVRKKRNNIHIFIVVLFSGLFAGFLSASVYDYLTNTNGHQMVLCGTIPGSLLVAILSGFLLLVLTVITIFKLMGMPENVATAFPVKLVYDRKDGIIHCLSPSNQFISHADYALQELGKEKPDVKNTLKERKNLENLILELIEYSIIMWLSQKYGNWWSLDQYTEGRFHGKNKSSTIMAFVDLPDRLREENIFFSTFSKYHEQETTDFARNLKSFRITLPKKTKFLAPINETDVPTIPLSLIRMENQYCDISINISYSMWHVGVPNINIEIPDSEEEQDVFNYSHERFATIEFLIDFKAYFNHWRSLFSSSDAYYQWVDDMLGSLYDDYCWIPFVEKIGDKSIKIKKGASFRIVYTKIGGEGE